MKRLTVVLGGLLCAVLTSGAMPAQKTQQPAMPPLEPGKMSLAMVHVTNRGLEEAIPVAVESSKPVPVVVTETPAVELSESSLGRLADRVGTSAASRKWEYHQVRLVSGLDPTGTLNALGGEGWELTGVTVPAPGGLMAILKRPRK
jgi:hypothetical protein